jgi:valyl-tRNA synthetase
MPRPHPPRPRPRGLPRQGLAVEGRVRRHHHPPDAPPRLVGGLVARALHHGRRPVAAVTEVFVRLYDEGLIYRGKRLVNWDPCCTPPCPIWKSCPKKKKAPVALPLPAGRRFRGGAGGCHHAPRNHARRHRRGREPADERYQHLIGSSPPAADRPADPIIADDYVDKAFGTGCVKITPATRLQRLRSGQASRPAADQHLRPRREDTQRIADAHGSGYDPATTTPPRPMRGLDRFAARKRVVELRGARPGWRRSTRTP